MKRLFAVSSLAVTVMMASIILGSANKTNDAAAFGQVSFSASQSPTNADSDRMFAVQKYAPLAKSVTFGPNIVVHRFDPQWSLEDAAIIHNAIYVVYASSRTISFQRLGRLTNGQLQDIPLARDYSGLGFVYSNTALQGIRPRGGLDWYAIDGAKATLIPNPRTNTDRKIHTLANGEWCYPGLPGSGSAIDAMSVGMHRHSILSTRQLELATHGILDEAYAARCDNFNGQNFATVGPGVNVVFEIADGKARLFSIGRIVISDRNHLLIQAENWKLIEADVQQ